MRTRTVEKIAHMAIADEVEPRPARAHAVACLALRHCVEGAGRTPLVCAACHCAAGPAAASKAIHARVRGVAATRTALVAVGRVGVQGLRLEGRACVVAKGETEPTWRRHALFSCFSRTIHARRATRNGEASRNGTRGAIKKAVHFLHFPRATRLTLESRYFLHASAKRPHLQTCFTVNQRVSQSVSKGLWRPLTARHSVHRALRRPCCFVKQHVLGVGVHLVAKSWCAAASDSLR